MKIARVVAMVALAFLGITSIIGAVPMIVDPLGRPLRMPQSLLEHSPFHTFLVPGLILLVANGILSLVIFVAAVRRAQGYGWWVTLQGCVLVGWITVEVFMLRAAVWPHYLYWGVALILIWSGLALTRRVTAPE